MTGDRATTKRPVGADRPFPWRCRHCYKDEVVMGTTSYDAEIRYDGRLYAFTIPQLNLPICQACGEKVFTEKVDDQISAALRAHLHLLTPEDMRAGLKRLNMTQKEASERLGIAEATLSRWLTDTQIQSRALDNLLRVFFAFKDVQGGLCGEGQDPDLGKSPGKAGNGLHGDGKDRQTSKGPKSLMTMCPALAARLSANNLRFSDVKGRLNAISPLPQFSGLFTGGIRVAESRQQEKRSEFSQN